MNAREAERTCGSCLVPEPPGAGAAPAGWKSSARIDKLDAPSVRS